MVIAGHQQEAFHVALSQLPEDSGSFVASREGLIRDGDEILRWESMPHRKGNRQVGFMKSVGASRTADQRGRHIPIAYQFGGLYDAVPVRIPGQHDRYIRFGRTIVMDEGVPKASEPPATGEEKENN